MNEQYSLQGEEQFVKELHITKSKHPTTKSLASSVAQLSKSKSASILLKQQLPQNIMKKRFGQHFDLLKHSIQNLSDQCYKYGGLQFIKAEMDKNELTKEEYMNYCITRINKNFQLPQIKTRSASLKTITNRTKSIYERDSKMQYNKWYIKPEERFSKSKDKTKYDWNKNTFILNVVKAKGNVLQHEFLPKFIDHCKSKLKREPLLCQYTTIRKNDR